MYPSIEAGSIATGPKYTLAKNTAAWKNDNDSSMVASIVPLLSTMCTLVYIHTVGGKSVVAIQATAIKRYERIRGWKKHGYCA